MLSRLTTVSASELQELRECVNSFLHSVHCALYTLLALAGTTAPTEALTELAPNLEPKVVYAKGSSGGGRVVKPHPVTVRAWHSVWEHSLVRDSAGGCCTQFALSYGPYTAADVKRSL